MSMHRRWIPFLSLALLALPLDAGAQRRGRPVDLPEGEGKALVEAACSGCHGLDRVANDGYTRDGWMRLFGTMVDLPPSQAALVADYLAANFPEKPKLAPDRKSVV